MKRRVITVLIIVVCFLLECTVFQKIAFASITPNLLIVITSAFGFMRGKKEGMFVGFLSGLLVDIFFSELIGFYALVFMLIGYVNGFFKRIFYAEDIKLPLILIAASDFIYGHIVYFHVHYSKSVQLSILFEPYHYAGINIYYFSNINFIPAYFAY